MSDKDKILDDLKKIADNVENEAVKAVKQALKDGINLGRDSFNEWIKLGTNVIPPEIAKDVADLYLVAETATLAGNTIYAANILDRLNLAMSGYGSVFNSQSAKKAMAQWKAALSIITKFVSAIGGVASAGFTGLVKVGIDTAANIVENAADSAAKTID